MNRTLLAFYYEDLSGLAFGEWLLTPPAASSLPPALYEELLALDFKDDQALKTARHLIKQAADREGVSLPLERAREVLDSLFDRDVSLTSAFKKLADLRLAGCEAIPAVFVGLSSEFERLGVEPYRERAMTEASVLRTKLETESKKST